MYFDLLDGRSAKNISIGNRVSTYGNGGINIGWSFNSQYLSSNNDVTIANNYLELRRLSCYGVWDLIFSKKYEWF